MIKSISCGLPCRMALQDKVYLTGRGRPHRMKPAKLDKILCYMELREGDVAENQNIRSSRGAAEYNLTFEMVLPGGPVQFGFSNSPAGRLSPIDKPAKADRSGDRTRPP